MIQFPFKTKRKNQDEMINKVDECIENQKNLLIHAPAGIGKCVAGDTKILVSGELGNIEDFYQKNIEVNGISLDLKMEVGRGKIIKKEKSQLYRVTTNLGKEVEVTSDHKFLTIRKGNLFWLPLKELKPGDYIAAARELNLIEKEPEITFSFLGDQLNATLTTSPSLREIVKKIKKEKNLSYKQIAGKVGCSKPVISRECLKNMRIRAKYIKKLLNLANLDSRKVKIEEINFGKLPLKINIDKEFSYFVGLIIGDGSVRRGNIFLTTASFQHLNFFKKFAKRLGVKVQKVSGDNYTYYFSHKTLCNYLYLLSFPKKNKVSSISIPGIFFNNYQLLSSVLRGVYDTDGSFYQDKLEITTKSKNLKDSILNALLCFGINPIIKKKKVNSEIYYRIYICNINSIRKFADKIGFKDKEKQKRLKQFLEKNRKANLNLDIIPEIGDLIKNCRESMEIPHSRDKLYKIQETYSYKLRNPTREGLRKILTYFKEKSKKEPKEYKKLIQLSNSGIFWEKIKEIKKTKIDFVYDATVPKLSNFVGGGIILHNTVAALYPAVKHAKEKGLTVFFLTPRHSQHQIALETLKKMGISKATDIIGKRWLCNYSYENLDSREFQELCNYLKKEEKCKYFNKVYKKGDLTEDAKGKVNVLDKQLLNSEQVRKHCEEFCAYEISCQLAKRSLVIVADYFHLFNPYASSSFLSKIDKDLENSIIIVDEAHQLPGRARDLMSTKLTTFILRNAYREARDFESHIADDIENLRLKLQELADEKLKEVWESPMEKTELAKLINSFGGDFLEELSEISDLVKEDGKQRSFCSSLLNFIERWMESDEDFARIIRKKKVKDRMEFEIKLASLLPSKITSSIINDSYSTILMSATLQPLEMYADLLGIKNYQTAAFKPVFPKENRLNIISPIATSKYSKRNEEQYKTYANAIENIFGEVNGNTAVFFPSYIFLNKVKEFIKSEEVFEEARELTKEQKANILNRFIDSERALLLGVQGGSFDQGIDIPNNSLKCIIIAGLALATPDLETKSLIDCYNKKYGKGMEYGYIFPAIQKAIQASGRAIRSEKDKASVVYLDERFLWRNYRRVLEGEQFVVSKEPWREIEKFNNLKK